VQDLLPSDFATVQRVAQLFDIAATPNVQAGVQRSLAITSASAVAAPTASPFLVTPTKNSVLDDEA
jgi:hypothetical protein